MARTAIICAVVLVLVGCENKEELALKQQNEELTRQVEAKDQFIEDITSAIDAIHTSIEGAWNLEKNIVRQAGTVEKTEAASPLAVKNSIISRISDMRSLLSDNRKKIRNLEKRLKNSGHQYTALEKMVADLKTQLDERDKSITELSERVSMLNNEVQQKTSIIAAHEMTIAEKEKTIEDQAKNMNTVFYTVGKRSELKEQGVVESDGGILWGLMGTTTVLASNYDDGKFRPIDKEKETIIPIPGTIDEIVPKRSDSSYSVEQGENGNSVLVIFHPEDFWKEKHLAVVID